ncbi:MAG: clostripain-related cysteine peptidase [Planctomycetota bacterium]|jgi:hypothetical protein
MKNTLLVLFIACLLLAPTTSGFFSTPALPGEKKDEPEKPEAKEKADAPKAEPEKPEGKEKADAPKAEPEKPAGEEKKEPDHEWGVIYYMPYDNNLEVFGELIIGRIKQGVVSEKLVAAVQADFSDNGGMYRYRITSKDMKKTQLKSDDSADEDRIMEYMNWFAKEFHCRNYIVVFLNHGGKLDETSLDLRHSAGGKRWASGRVLGEKFRRFRKELPGKWPLLFLQQCGRGSLENLYSFRGTAEYIMSAPVTVGAPNTYYTNVIKWLSGKADAAGSDIAEKIADEDEHYSLYTCLETKKLDELPKRLNGVLDAFLKKDELAAAPAPVIFRPEPRETIMDVKTLFLKIAEKNETGKPEVDGFAKWLSDELFIMARFNKRARYFPGKLCGASIYYPSTSADIKRYGDLDLYRESRLPELWRKLIARPEKKK